MGKHSKKEDYNTKPFDPTLEPGKKAQEFDEQYGQNRRGRRSGDTPALDEYKKKNK